MIPIGIRFGSPDTYITEFVPVQEEVCEENFWKACKITFKEQAYNYTLETCTTPLVKKCDEQTGQRRQQESYGAPPPEPETVCKIWFESECNTTFSQVSESERAWRLEDGLTSRRIVLISTNEIPFQSPIDEEAKPRTWCNKIPRQICAPENCHMEQGEPECREIVLESTVKKPEEVCDLQPTKQCHQVTNLVPHLEQQVVCKDIPKEVCHLRLDNPQVVQRPVTLKWCTKPEVQPSSSYGAPQVT